METISPVNREVKGNIILYQRHREGGHEDTESAEERFTLSSGHSAACQTRGLPPRGMWVLPPWGQEGGGGGGVGGRCVGGSSGEKKNLIRYTWDHSSGCGMWVILRCSWQRGKRDRRWAQC